MTGFVLRSLLIGLLCLSLWAGGTVAGWADVVYQQRSPSRDGIGKVYMGREIAQVMGHLGAGWLERSSRNREADRKSVV